MFLTHKVKRYIDRSLRHRGQAGVVKVLSVGAATMPQMSEHR
jgi:hypothetical protein